MFKATTDSSIHWLQFQSLHTIIPIEKYLKKLDGLTSNCCGCCIRNVEAIL